MVPSLTPQSVTMVDVDVQLNIAGSDIVATQVLVQPFPSRLVIVYDPAGKAENAALD